MTTEQFYGEQIQISESMLDGARDCLVALIEKQPDRIPEILSGWGKWDLFVLMTLLDNLSPIVTREWASRTHL